MPLLNFNMCPDSDFKLFGPLVLIQVFNLLTYLSMLLLRMVPNEPSLFTGGWPGTHPRTPYLFFPVSEDYAGSQTGLISMNLYFRPNDSLWRRVYMEIQMHYRIVRTPLPTQRRRWNITPSCVREAVVCSERGWANGGPTVKRSDRASFALYFAVGNGWSSQPVVRGLCQTHFLSLYFMFSLPARS